MPNETLFQVKAIYSYSRIHKDELSIKPNDLIHVTRMVCVSFVRRAVADVIRRCLFSRSKMGGMKGFSTVDEASFRPIMSHVFTTRKVENIAVDFEKERAAFFDDLLVHSPHVHNSTDTTTTTAAAKKKVPVKARVLYDYRKAADDELSLSVNDIVTILDKHLDDEGWWKVNSRAEAVCVNSLSFSIRRANSMDEWASFPVSHPSFVDDSPVSVR